MHNLPIEKELDFYTLGEGPWRHLERLIQARPLSTKVCNRKQENLASSEFYLGAAKLHSIEEKHISELICLVTDRELFRRR